VILTHLHGERLFSKMAARQVLFIISLVFLNEIQSDKLTRNDFQFNFKTIQNVLWWSVYMAAFSVRFFLMWQNIINRCDWSYMQKHTNHETVRDQAIFIAGVGPVQMGMGQWFFLTLHIHGTNIFFTKEMPMGQIIFLMHYLVAEFSWMNKKNLPE